MPVTEIATFSVVEPDTLHSEPIASLLEQGIRSQINFSSQPVYLFTEVTNERSVYLISGWGSIDQHMESTKSQVNQEVMSVLVPKHLGFNGLVHPAIDFTTFPSDVAVVVIQRFEVADGADSVKDLFTSAKWVHSGVDEHNGGHRISAYGSLEGAEVLKTAEGVVTEATVVLKRAVSFEVDGGKQVA
ncbi:hypothetical protein H0H93_003211 [Arthromyces matolae]|nr:hypothetical protein H0H93_003211 [Arthromyces matolae]